MLLFGCLEIVEGFNVRIFATGSTCHGMAIQSEVPSNASQCEVAIWIKIHVGEYSAVYNGETFMISIFFFMHAQ